LKPAERELSQLAAFPAGSSAKPKRAIAVPSPRGRIALLGFTHRQIRTSRAHIPLNRHRRKQIPTVIKTLGDYIQAKRYEKGLHPNQIAGKMAIETALILAWESGSRTPDEKQWQVLRDLLSFDSGVDFPKPHKGRLLAFTQSATSGLGTLYSQHLCPNASPKRKCA
jgi:DNA-binding transcriptional regulator YiaG